MTIQTIQDCPEWPDWCFDTFAGHSLLDPDLGAVELFQKSNLCWTIIPKGYIHKVSTECVVLLHCHGVVGADEEEHIH